MSTGSPCCYRVALFWAHSGCSELLAGHIQPGENEQQVRFMASPSSCLGSCVLIEQVSFDYVGLIFLQKHMKNFSLKS